MRHLATLAVVCAIAVVGLVAPASAHAATPRVHTNSTCIGCW